MDNRAQDPSGYYGLTEQDIIDALVKADPELEVLVRAHGRSTAKNHNWSHLLTCSVFAN